MGAPVLFLWVSQFFSLVSLAYLWWWASRCRCGKCSFHENERRMAALKQVELRHDFMHKGIGFKDTDPDRYDCPDEACVRNKTRR